MFKIFVLLLSGLTATNSFAQQLTEKWVSCFGGTEWDEATGIMQVDSTYWVVGSTESNDGDISYCHGYDDVWLLNLDKNGNLISEKTYGGSKGEGPFTTILKLNDSIFYIASGSNSSDGDISNNPWPGPLGNYWILKINNRGDILWERMCGGSDIELIENALITTDGGIIALGISSSFDGDITDPHGIGQYDIWMIKLGSDGQKQWELSLGGRGNETYGSIIQTSDGGFLVAGNTDGMGGGNFDSSCNFHNPGSGYDDAWVIKLDTAHEIEWQQCYGGHYGDSFGNAIELPDGYIFLGDTESNDGDVTGFHVPPQIYMGDIWVVKTDKTGNLLWQKCLGGTNSDYAYTIFTTTDGGYMIVGSTRSSDGDVTGYHGTHGWSDDIWFAKIDSVGNLLWQYCYGAQYDEFLYRGVVQKSDWDYVLAIGTNSGEWRCYSGGYPDFRIAELYDSTVGVNVTSAKNVQAKVYPNPANSVLNVELANTPRANNTTIEMIDINGKRVLKYIPKNKMSHLNINQLKSGLYLVKIETGTAITTQCIIKR